MSNLFALGLIAIISEVIYIGVPLNSKYVGFKDFHLKANKTQDSLIFFALRFIGIITSSTVSIFN